MSDITDDGTTLRRRQVPPGARPLPDRRHGHHRRWTTASRSGFAVGLVRLALARTGPGAVLRRQVVVDAGRRSSAAGTFCVNILADDQEDVSPGVRQQGAGQVRRDRLEALGQRLARSSTACSPTSTARSATSSSRATTSSWSGVVDDLEVSHEGGAAHLLPGRLRPLRGLSGPWRSTRWATRCPTSIPMRTSIPTPSSSVR